MYMKKWIMICACVAVFQTALAQRITRQYNNVSFSAALKDLNARQHKYTINFVYDELEDFRVTKSIRNQSVQLENIHERYSSSCRSLVSKES